MPPLPLLDFILDLILDFIFDLDFLDGFFFGVGFRVGLGVGVGVRSDGAWLSTTEGCCELEGEEEGGSVGD